MNETPSYLDPQPDCVCGEAWEDHVESPDFEEDGSVWLPSKGCNRFEPKDAHYYEELRQEAELARWENR